MRGTLLLLALVLATPVGAQHAGHDKWHAEVYSKWLTPGGNSCCNNMDCRPAKSRAAVGGYEVEINGQWVPVPPSTIRPYVSPDMSDHVCHQGTRIICFVAGGGV